MSTEQILKHKEINKIFALLPHLKQMEYFPEFLKSKKNIFIEKPFLISQKNLVLFYKKTKKILKINIYLLIGGFMML